MHLRGDAFTEGQKERNFVYYGALTVRDSSLSACTQAVLAAETSYLDLAYDYLAEAALMDLDDLEHKTPRTARRSTSRDLDRPRPRPGGTPRTSGHLLLRTSPPPRHHVCNGDFLQLLHDRAPITLSIENPVARRNPAPLRLQWREARRRASRTVGPRLAHLAMELIDDATTGSKERAGLPGCGVQPSPSTARDRSITTSSSDLARKWRESVRKVWPRRAERDSDASDGLAQGAMMRLTGTEPLAAW